MIFESMRPSAERRSIKYLKKAFVYFLLFVFVFTTTPSFVLAYRGAGQKGAAGAAKPVTENAEPDDLPPLPFDKTVQSPAPHSQAFLQNISAIAKKDAQADRGTSWWLWAGLGCLGTLSGSILGVAAVVLGYMISTPVPVNRIMGKSNDYVLLYTSYYQEETRSANGGAALIGCAAPYVALLIGGLIYLAYTNQL